MIMIYTMVLLGLLVVMVDIFNVKFGQSTNFHDQNDWKNVPL